MSYGNAPPPEGAPVAPPDLIGASLFYGLVAVLTIAREGAYAIALVAGRAGFDACLFAVLALNVAGFIASLWFLALRRWAWRLAIAYAVVELGLRVFYAGRYVLGGSVNITAALGELALAVVFIVVLGYTASSGTRELIEKRESYRRAQAAQS